MNTRILVVDDEPDMVVIMKLTLETKGYQVITAYDGEEGLQKACDEAPDLIILDILMPKVFGSDMAAALQNNPATAKIPLIYLTNFPIPYLTGKEGAYNTTQKDPLGNIFLSKSCSDEELLSAIQELLRTRKA